MTTSQQPDDGQRTIRKNHRSDQRHSTPDTSNSDNASDAFAPSKAADFNIADLQRIVLLRLPDKAQPGSGALSV